MEILSAMSMQSAYTKNTINDITCKGDKWIDNIYLPNLITTSRHNILFFSYFQDIKARRNRRMAQRNRPASQPGHTNNTLNNLTTTNGNKLAEQTSKLLQIETNGEAKEEVATEVIELKSRNSPPKEQKPIQLPPPSIAVNESRYLFTHPDP